MDKASGTAAQALVLDLEDAVAEERLDDARQLVHDFLKAHPDRSRQQIWVRINPIETAKSLADLAAIVGGAPDGVLLPKCGGSDDIQRLDHYLTALEQREGVTKGSIKIIAVATETAGSMFELGSYRHCSKRLHGLTWGAEDLSTALGASTNKNEDGGYRHPYQMARSLCLFGAKAAGMHPIDTIFANFRDPAALGAEVQRAREDGFTAKFAIHPDQIEVINSGFRPSDSELAHARAVVAAFRSAEGVGVAQVNGMMLDKPHLTQALQLLEAAGIAA
jgi:citrate lyase subunit beta/citryl-CoA lyase